jgi:hypothetical protein
LSSMRPSSWNGVGAIAKVPAALWVSFMTCASALLLRHSGAMRSIEPGISRFPDVQLHIWGSRFARAGMTVSIKTAARPS